MSESKFLKHKKMLQEVLDEHSQHALVSSTTHLFIQMFLNDQPIPKGLFINFNGSESFSSPMIQTYDNKSSSVHTHQTLTEFLAFLPYDYWKNHINHTILGDKEFISSAVKQAFYQGNVDFFAEMVFAVIKLGINWEAESKLPEYSENMNDSEGNIASFKAPYSFQKSFYSDNNLSSIEAFHGAAFNLNSAFLTHLPVLLSSQRKISDENVEKLHMIIKFMQTALYHNLAGNFYDTHKTPETFTPFKHITDMESLKQWNKDNHLSYSDTIVSLNHPDDKHNLMATFLSIRKLLSHANSFINKTSNKSFQRQKNITEESTHQLKKEDVFPQALKNNASIIEYLFNDVLGNIPKGAFKPSNLSEIIKDTLIFDYYFNSNISEKLIQKTTGTPKQWEKELNMVVTNLLNFNVSNDAFFNNCYSINFIAIYKLKNLVQSNNIIQNMELPSVCGLFNSDIPAKGFKISKNDMTTYKAGISHAVKIVNNFFHMHISNTSNLNHFLASSENFFAPENRQKIATLFDNPALKESPILGKKEFPELSDEEISHLLMKFTVTESTKKTKSLKF